MYDVEFKQRIKRAMGTWIYAFVIMTCLFVTGMAHAQQRFVVVNNLLMTDMQIAQLDQAACTQIPNGNYWLNLNTGVWGFAGNSHPQGRIGEYCRSQQEPRRKSLSERRMLFSTGDWIR